MPRKLTPRWVVYQDDPPMMQDGARTLGGIVAFPTRREAVRWMRTVPKNEPKPQLFKLTPDPSGEE